MSDLPLGWIEVSCGELADKIQYGYTESAVYEPVGPKFLRITDLQGGTVNWDSVPYCRISEAQIDNYRLSANDIVFARTGATTGKSFLLGNCPPAVFASYLIRVQVNRQIEAKYLAYFFQSPDYWHQISESLSGTAQPNCNATKLSQIRLPLAPPKEQKHIVDKLDTLLAQVEECRKKTDRVAVILKRFRQAILDAATNGNMAQLFGFLDESKPQKLGHFIEYLKTGPFGSSLHKADYITGGVPVINPMHIHAGIIVPTEDITLTEDKAKELAEFRFKCGDIVIARRGIMGRCAVIGNIEQGWMCGTGSMIVHPNDSISSEYLQMLLSSPKVVEALEGDAVGSTMINLNQRILLNLEVSAPPIEIQAEIVKQVKTLTNLADRLETKLRHARKAVERITPALLAKAFRGELVPQDPDAEPASALLERIRLARITADGITGSTRKATVIPGEQTEDFIEQAAFLAPHSPPDMPKRIGARNPFLSSPTGQRSPVRVNAPTSRGFLSHGNRLIENHLENHRTDNDLDKNPLTEIENDTKNDMKNDMENDIKNGTMQNQTIFHVKTAADLVKFLAESPRPAKPSAIIEELELELNDFYELVREAVAKGWIERPEPGPAEPLLRVNREPQGEPPCV